MKSRRDGLFIVSNPKKWERIVTTNPKRVSCWKSTGASSGLWKDQTASQCFFLFFSGAENTPRHIRSHRPAPLKNKKKTWVRWLAIYKQAIPTGFGRSPKSKAYALREEMWVMISVLCRFQFWFYLTSTFPPSLLHSTAICTLQLVGMARHVLPSCSPLDERRL